MSREICALERKLWQQVEEALTKGVIERREKILASL